LTGWREATAEAIFDHAMVPALEPLNTYLCMHEADDTSKDLPLDVQL
jgi:hypothetical protein